MARVEVITAGKHDSTHGVGEAIAQRLAAAGHEVEAADAREVREPPDGAIVLGSAIYMGRWRKPARNLAQRLAKESGRRPVWMFSVGPLGEPPEPEVPPLEQLVGPEAAALARDHRVFSGRLERESLGRLERAAADAQKAPEGDFRDWEEIESWAEGIAAELQR